MNASETPIKVLHFAKVREGDVLRCRVEIYRDDSAYLVGDEIELGFEFEPNCEDRASEYLTRLGYQRDHTVPDA